MKEHESYQTGWSEITGNTCPEGWDMIEPKGHSKPHHQLFAPSKPGGLWRFTLPFSLLYSLWDTHTHLHTHSARIYTDTYRWWKINGSIGALEIQELSCSYSRVCYWTDRLSLQVSTIHMLPKDAHIILHFVEHVFPPVVSAELIQHNDSGL